MEDCKNPRNDLKIVVIGGGHGLSTSLRGLKKLTTNLTAIVTVADDGGSSGALRRDIGILPPGDIRNCLAALSDDEEFLTQVLQYRFPVETSISGHNLGNLLLTALANITGSFEQGIQELSRLLSIRGKVVPSTFTDINLVADVETLDKDGSVTVERILGESNISNRNGRILNLYIDPENAAANPAAIREILSADLITLGPGSLYTSVLPNLKVRGIQLAIQATHGKIIYISNVSTQPGETNNFTCYDHAKIIREALPNVVLDGVICNNKHKPERPGTSDWVKIEERLLSEFTVFQGDLIDERFPWRHDSDKLAAMVIATYQKLIANENNENTFNNNLS